MANKAAKNLLKGIKDQSFYSLIYHSIYIVSGLVFLLIMWVPSWVYGNISFQGQNSPIDNIQIINQVPINIRLYLTVLATLVAVIWYFSVEFLWIRSKREEIDKENKELKKIAIRVRKQIDENKSEITNN